MESHKRSFCRTLGSGVRRNAAPDDRFRMTFADALDGPGVAESVRLRPPVRRSRAALRTTVAMSGLTVERAGAVIGRTGGCRTGVRGEIDQPSSLSPFRRCTSVSLFVIPAEAGYLRKARVVPPNRPPRRKPGSSWVKHCNDLLRPSQLGPGLRRGSRKGFAKVPRTPGSMDGGDGDGGHRGIDMTP